jgi:crossover junction endodeoxyribonuclease RusA
MAEVPLNIINESSDSKIMARDVFASKLIVELVIDGEPVSKQRPRFARNKGGGVYTPKNTKEAQQVIGWSIRSAYRQLVPEPDGAFWVVLHFYTKNRQRRDLDNMCKLVFDACNGLVWRDDAQVEVLTARVTRQSERPRTEMEIYQIVSDTPFIRCKACKRTVRTYPSWPHRNYCSKRCSDAAMRNGIDVPCANCGKEIHRAECSLAATRQHFCSVECKSLHLTKECTCAKCGALFRKPKSQVRSGRTFCSLRCQSEMYKTERAKEYTRCKACSLASLASASDARPNLDDASTPSSTSSKRLTQIPEDALTSRDEVPENRPQTGLNPGVGGGR